MVLAFLWNIYEITEHHQLPISFCYVETLMKKPFMQNISENISIIYRQSSRTFRFDVLIIYWCRRIRLGTISYEINLFVTKLSRTINCVPKIIIQAVNSPLIHAKCHSNSVHSHFWTFKNLSPLYLIILKCENRVFCLNIILESNEIYKNHVEYIEKL